jgi:hypothetical protein
MFTTLLLITFLPLLASGSSTVVALTDAELNQLLQLVLAQLPAGATQIPIILLETFGMNTATVIAYIVNAGFTILM